MNKEQLKAKLEAKFRFTQDLAYEIADAGKPVISESVAADLVEQLVEMFSDVMSNADPSDLNPEFGLNGSEIYLECIDVSDIGVSDHDINGVLEDFFAIEEDEDEDLESISSTGREGRE